MKRRFAVTVCFVSLLTACSASPAPSAAPEPTTSAAPDTETTPAQEDGEEPAVAAKSFDELRKAVMACKLDEEGDLVADCEAHEAWTAEQPALESSKGIASLLTMLSSADSKSRRLAAERLAMSLHEETLDAATADRLIAACGKERDENLMDAMAAMLSGQNLVKVGKIENAIAMAKAHQSAAFTEAFLLHVGFSNRDKTVLAWAAEAGKSKTASMRNAALNAASDSLSELPEQACKLVDSFRSDKDNFTKSRARSLLAGGRKCTSYFDRLLDDLASVKLKKPDDKGFGVDQSYGTALASLCLNEKLSAAQRSKADKAARRLAEATEINPGTRYYALSAIVRCDPTGGKAFVAKFAKDKDATVANQAAELSK